MKNISFLMNKTGHWQLSPAYDITYANDESNRWLAKHQMSVNGKTENFLTDDLVACGKHMNLSNGRICEIMSEVSRALNLWDSCAEKSFVGEQEMEYIKKHFSIIL